MNGLFMKISGVRWFCWMSVVMPGTKMNLPWFLPLGIAKEKICIFVQEWALRFYCLTFPLNLCTGRSLWCHLCPMGSFLYPGVLGRLFLSHYFPSSFFFMPLLGLTSLRSICWLRCVFPLPSMQTNLLTNSSAGKGWEGIFRYWFNSFSCLQKNNDLCKELPISFQRSSQQEETRLMLIGKYPLLPFRAILFCFHF